jgi:hypothetical protein
MTLANDPEIQADKSAKKLFEWDPVTGQYKMSQSKKLSADAPQSVKDKVHKAYVADGLSKKAQKELGDIAKDNRRTQ